MRASSEPTRHAEAERRIKFVFVVFSTVLAALLLGGSVARDAAQAATPPSGQIGPPPSSSSVSWDGQDYAAQAILDPAACPKGTPDTICDHFLLTVTAPPSFYESNTGGARVRIEWSDESDDFDLYVYDKDGNEVARSAAGGTTSEEAFVQGANSAASPYEVRVVPFLVVNATDPPPPGGADDMDYDGVASFESTPGGFPTNPTRFTSGMLFGPATVVDPQRTEGEPVNWIDKDGNYWESGPYGTSTSQSFIHRSIDGGDQFNIVSPIALRPNPPPGGGDTDIVTDDQGIAYFTDLEGLINLDASVSNDNGNSWRKNPAATAVTVVPPTTLVDRQWFTVDNGANTTAGTPGAPNAAGAADNTVFLAYRQVPAGSFIISTPGSTGPADPVGGLVYSNSSASVLPVSTGAPCGQMRFDPVTRNLYYPCGKGDHVEITVGHVNVGQRTGITYTKVQAPPSPGGTVGDIFPGVATDKAGNLYAVWIDEINHNVYYAASKNAGQTWGPVRQINGNDANTNVFPWAQAGADGRLVVAWLGNSSRQDSDTMPSWYNNRRAATAFKWYGYVSQIRDAAGSSPYFAQQRFTEKPMHYGQICNAGLACAISGGDRTMADFFAVFIDRDGSLRFVYNDTTSQHHGAHIFETRQLRGVTPLGGFINKPFPTNPMPDRTGDANDPHYSPVGPGPGGSAGPNRPELDFTQLQLTKLNETTLRVQMTLAAPPATVVPPIGKTRSVWLTRFQALSRGDGVPPEGPEEAYRIFYVGAEKIGAAGAMTFFAGSGESAQNATAGNGCNTTTAENCKIVQYPSEVTAAGSVSGNVITIDVPLQTGFGPDRPILGGGVLYNVTAFSFGRNDSTGRTPDLYADLDATRAFDFVFPVGAPPPPPRDPIVVLTKTGPATVKKGTFFNYTISYTNAGPAASQNARIVDTLPREVVFVSASNGGTYDRSTHKVTYNLGTVPAAASGSVTLRVRLQGTSSVPVGTAIVNRADFTGDLTVSPPTAVWTSTVAP